MTITVIVFLGSATMTGQMVGIVTALMISLFLWIGRKLYGYEVRKNGEWVEEAGAFEHKPKPRKVNKHGRTAGENLGYWVTYIIIGPKAAKGDDHE